MNSKQRRKNRNTAKELNSLVYQKIKDNHVCENCGEKGAHFVVAPDFLGFNLQEIMDARSEGVKLLETPGFWTCSKMYGEDGRRLSS